MMLSDFRDNSEAPDPRDSRPVEEVTKSRTGQSGYAKPEIRIQIMRWITSLGLPTSGAEVLTDQFCEMVKKKALEHGDRKRRIVFELGYDNEYLNIFIPTELDRDPETLLAEYALNYNLKGEWSIAQHKRKMGGMLHICKPVATARSKKAKEKAAFKAVDKLSQRDAKLMLEALQAMLAKR